MQLPQEIKILVSGFIADEVRATDPKCYRSARRLQALCRGTLTRMRRNVCYLCACTQPGPHRTLYWVCDDCLTAISGGAVLPVPYDDEGYDTDGFDRDGLDRDGYDYYGFNPVGRDRHGYRYDDGFYSSSEYNYCPDW